MSADDERDDSVEIQPIERRSTPRGPVPGLTVAVLEGAPLANKNFEAAEFGLESLFLSGDVAAKAAPKSEFRLLLTYGDTAVECMAACVRAEDGERIGAVLRLVDGEDEARELLAEVLKPSGIPLGQH
jgi:hypothetical protein